MSELRRRYSYCVADGLSEGGVVSRYLRLVLNVQETVGFTVEQTRPPSVSDNTNRPLTRTTIKVKPQ